MSQEFQQQWLSAYLDDELSSDERALVERRLEEDPEARELLEDLRRVRGLVATLPAWSGAEFRFDPSRLSDDSVDEDDDGAGIRADTDQYATDDDHQENLDSLRLVAVPNKNHQASRISPAAWRGILSLAAGVLLLILVAPMVQRHLSQNEFALSTRMAPGANVSDGLDDTLSGSGGGGMPGGLGGLGGGMGSGVSIMPSEDFHESTKLNEAVSELSPTIATNVAASNTPSDPGSVYDLGHAARGAAAPPDSMPPPAPKTSRSLGGGPSPEARGFAVPASPNLPAVPSPAANPPITEPPPGPINSATDLSLNPLDSVASADASRSAADLGSVIAKSLPNTPEAKPDRFEQGEQRGQRDMKEQFDSKDRAAERSFDMPADKALKSESVAGAATNGNLQSSAFFNLNNFTCARSNAWSESEVAQALPELRSVLPNSVTATSNEPTEFQQQVGAKGKSASELGDAPGDANDWLICELPKTSDVNHFLSQIQNAQPLTQVPLPNVVMDSSDARFRFQNLKEPSDTDRASNALAGKALADNEPAGNARSSNAPAKNDLAKGAPPSGGAAQELPAPANKPTSGQPSSGRVPPANALSDGKEDVARTKQKAQSAGKAQSSGRIVLFVSESEAQKIMETVSGKQTQNFWRVVPGGKDSGRSDSFGVSQSPNDDRKRVVLILNQSP